MLFKKFADLTQGNRTVIEYVNEFDALSKYGMTLADTKEKKSEKFVSGLNDYLGARLLNHVEEQMDKLINIALRHEGRLQNSKPSVTVKEEANARIRVIQNATTVYKLDI